MCLVHSKTELARYIRIYILQPTNIIREYGLKKLALLKDFYNIEDMYNYMQLRAHMFAFVYAISTFTSVSYCMYANDCVFVRIRE